MNLSDEELMLLEQLTYIDTNLCNAVGMDKKQFEKITKAESVSEIVEQFDGHLDELSQMGDIPDYVYYQGNELATIINEIKNNPKLMDLNIKETVPHTSKSSTNTVIDKMVFYEGNSNSLPDDAIVCFKGTLDSDEWKDNFYLLHEADTPVNKDALKYVESLPFDNITVVGHSKGANKAAYCYYESDKVVGCVAMDGPGFPETYYKENPKAANKAMTCGNIRSYAVKGDFVNILMNEYYGTHTKYCEGYGRKQFFENHCPGSFFHYCYEADGNAYLYRNPDGSLLEFTEQNETMKRLHKFTLFLQKNMPENTKKEVAEYLGNCAALALGGDSTVVNVNGVIYTKKDIVDYILSDKDKMSTILAYLLVYANEYGLDGSDLQALLPLKYKWVAPLFDLIRANFKDGEVDALFIDTVNKLAGKKISKFMTVEELDELIYDTQNKYNSLVNMDGMGKALVDYNMPYKFFPGTTITAPSTNPKMPTVHFGEDSNNGTEAASNNITIGSGGLSGRKTSAGNAMSNSMFATVDKDTMYVDVAEFERHRKDIYNAADKLIFNAKPAFDKEESICGTESVFLLTDYWHKVIDTTDRFREFKMGPADLLMRNTLKSLLDVDAESAETIKVQGGNSETHTG